MKNSSNLLKTYTKQLNPKEIYLKIVWNNNIFDCLKFKSKNCLLELTFF